MQLSIATILATMGSDSSDGYSVSNASLPSEAPAPSRGRPRIERRRFVVDSSESSDSGADLDDHAARAGSPLDSPVDLDDLLNISTDSLELHAMAVEAWSLSNCAKQLRMSRADGIKVPPRPFKCPNSCFDSVLVVLLSHIEEQLVQVARPAAGAHCKVTSNHAHRNRKREVPDTSVQNPTLEWARSQWAQLCQFVPRSERARFRRTYISLATVLVTMVMMTTTTTMQHCPPPPLPGGAQKVSSGLPSASERRGGNAKCSGTFSAALNVPRVRERLAQIAGRVLGIATSAAATVTKSLRATTRRHHGHHVVHHHSLAQTAVHPCLHFHRNDRLATTSQAGLATTAAQQVACVSIPIPLVALLVNFGTSVSSWRQKVGAQLSKTRLTRLGVARDRFDIQIQTMVDVEAKVRAVCV